MAAKQTLPFEDELELPEAWEAAASTRSKSLKFPKTLGGVADALYALRVKRLALAAEVKQLATDQAALEFHAHALLIKNDASRATGKTGQISKGEDYLPKIVDWDVFYKYIKRTGQFEFLNRAPNRAAFKERWALKKGVPGTEVYGRAKINISAAPSKK